MNKDVNSEKLREISDKIDFFDIIRSKVDDDKLGKEVLFAEDMLNNKIKNLVIFADNKGIGRIEKTFVLRARNYIFYLDRF